MRYLLIDHITGWQADRSIRGVKNVAMSEDFLEFHFPRNPIMPGVLLLEALTQLTGWLEAASSDFRNWFLISSVKKSRFYSFALPGDQVQFEVELVTGTDVTAGTPLPAGGEDESSSAAYPVKLYRGIGTVNGKKKIVAEFEGIVVPAAEIEDPEEQKRLFQVLTREGR